MNIKELAKQAGYLPDMFGIGHWDSPEFKRFAELVRQDEREACAKVCEKLGEAYVDNYAVRSAYDCAAAIRARGDKYD